jgi:transposase-like protein
MEKQNLFKWKHYQPDIILLTVRWHLLYNLSFRDLVDMMEERGLSMVTKAAKRFFKKALVACYSTSPRVVTVDKNPAYPFCP